MTRELLLESTKSLIKICDDIYIKVDRTPQKRISNDDFELVKTFNLLVETNQRNLDILYPERQKSEVRTLSFRNVHNDIEEVSNE